MGFNWVYPVKAHKTVGYYYSEWILSKREKREVCKHPYALPTSMHSKTL